MNPDERVQKAKEALRNCNLCEFRCGANRWEGQVGLCGVDSHAHILRDFVNCWQEVGSEPCYTILFNGCIFRCPYCILGPMIQEPQRGQKFDVDEFSWKARLMKRRGLENINFLGGEATIHLFPILRLVQELPPGMKKNLHSYLYFTPETLELLRGPFDLFLAEVRYGNDQCAARYSQAPRYTEVVRRNLMELKGFQNLTIRHLLLPGHLECCYRPIVEWVAKNLPRAKFSVGNEYVPCYKAGHYPEINRRVSDAEFREALRQAREHELNLIYRYVSPINPNLN